MNQRFTIRPASVIDSENIASMQERLAIYCGYSMEHFALDASNVQHIIEHDDQACYYVAENHAELVGMMLCHRIPLSWRGSSGVYVEDLYVKPPYRHGLGVGRLLLGRACALAVKYANNNPEAAFLRLDTSLHDNADTLGFYRRLGMNEDNINFRLYGHAIAQLANM